jgi:hypothetical protein
MEKLTDSIEQNYKFFQDKLTHCEDIEFRILNPRNIKGKQIIFMYCENIVDETLLYESLLEKVVKNYPHGKFSHLPKSLFRATDYSCPQRLLVKLMRFPTKFGSLLYPFSYGGKKI